MADVNDLGHENAPHAGQAPELRFLCRITARVAPLVTLGSGPYGERRFVPIIGGTVQGGSLSGEVLSGGVDWQIQRHDGTLDIKAQYVIRTDDGALIEVESRGYRHGPAEVMARLAKGEPVAPEEYYFRTAMTFQTGAPSWAQLNSVLAIGKAIREPGAAILDVYLVN
jgi:hypothetical protein